MARCQHAHSTLCQYTHKYDWGELGIIIETFIAYQCDDCGQMLRTEVTQEDLDKPDLPLVDEGMWDAAIHAATLRTHPEAQADGTVKFLQVALR